MGRLSCIVFPVDLPVYIFCVLVVLQCNGKALTDAIVFNPWRKT